MQKRARLNRDFGVWAISLLSAQKPLAERMGTLYTGVPLGTPHFVRYAEA